MHKKISVWITLFFFVFSTPLQASTALTSASTLELNDAFSLTLPPELGQINSVFQGDSKKFVIEIQDAHAVYGAQQNIARLVEYLNADHAYTMIAAEGAPAGDIDTSPISWVPDPERRRQVLDLLLYRGFITGPEYQHAAGEKSFRYIGVEDPALYRQNREEYLGAGKIRPEAQRFVNLLARELNTIKRKVYGDLLMETDEMIRKAREHEKDSSKTVEDLGKMIERARDLGISETAFPTLTGLLAAKDFEREINWTHLSEELRTILKALGREAGKKELKAYLGEASEKAVHDLRRDMEAADISVETYPDFLKYARFLEFVSKIRATPAFMHEKESLEESLYEILISTPDERVTYQIDRLNGYLELLLSLELRRDQYEKLMDLKKHFPWNKIKNWIQKFQPDFDLDRDAGRFFRPFEFFYETARKRDQVMVSNLIREMESAGMHKAVLISGGFHTEGVSDELREKGISHLVITPRINEIESGHDEKYLAALKQDKNSLEQTLIDFMNQTLNQEPGSLDPYAPIVTLVTYLRLMSSILDAQIRGGDRKAAASTARELRDTVTGALQLPARLRQAFQELRIQPNGRMAISLADGRRLTIVPSAPAQPTGRWQDLVGTLPELSWIVQGTASSAKSELRTEHIRPSHFPGDQVLKHLSLDLTSGGLRNAFYRNVDVYDVIDKMLTAYQQRYQSDLQNLELKDIQEIGVLSDGAEGVISDQLLRIMALQAFKSLGDPQAVKTWAAIFTRIAPVRNTLVRMKFPAALYFLAHADRQLHGQVLEALRESPISDEEFPSWVQPSQDYFLQGTLYAGGAAETDVLARYEELIEQINQSVTRGDKENDVLPYHPDMNNPNEILILLKPPGTAENPETVREFILRMVAFGYEPSGIRVLRGAGENAADGGIPEALVGMHYPEISEFALHGPGGENDSPNYLRPEVIDRMRQFYSQYEGRLLSEFTGFPEGHPELDRPFAFDQTPILSISQLLEQPDALSREEMIQILYDRYTYLMETKAPDGSDALMYRAERELGMDMPHQATQKDGLFSEEYVEHSPNTKEVALIVDPRLNGGKPFFAPTLFFWHLRNMFNQPDHTTLAVAMRPVSAEAASLKEMRGYFLGKGPAPDGAPIPGSMRGDAITGELGGNDASLVNIVSNIAHGSASMLEGAGEVRLWFADMREIAERGEEAMLPISDTPFGKAMLDAGYSTDEIKYFLSNPMVTSDDGQEPLKDVLGGMNADKALNKLMQLIPPYQLERTAEQALGDLEFDHISAGDYPGDEVMRLISFNFRERGVRHADYQQINFFEDLKHAVRLYAQKHKTQLESGGLSSVPESGALLGRSFPRISEQALKIMSYLALKETDPLLRRAWAAMFVRIIPVRNTMLKFHFPGVLYFLARVDAELGGQILQTLQTVNLEDSPGFKRYVDTSIMTFLDDSEYFEQDPVRLSRQIRDRVQQDVNSGRHFDEIMPYTPAPQGDNPTEMLMLLKPPGTVEHPQVVQEFFMRAYAAGYEPAGIRLFHSTIPLEVVALHYGEIGAYALYGGQGDGAAVSSLTEEAAHLFRQRYGQYEGRQLSEFPGFAGAAAGVPDQVFQLPQDDPARHIIGLQQLMADHPHLGRDEITRILYDRYTYLMRNGLIYTMDRELDAWIEGGSHSGAYQSAQKRGLFSESFIQQPPLTLEVALFQHPQLYQGRPFYAPNLFYWHLERMFTDPANTTLAVVLRAKTSEAESLDDMRKYFLGKGISRDKYPIQGSWRGDGGLGILGNDPTLVNEVSNLGHGSASMIESLFETMLWFSDFNQIRARGANGMRSPGEVTFGRALLREGYSLEEIKHLLTNPMVAVDGQDQTLKDALGGLSPSQAVELIKQKFPRAEMRSVAEAPITYLSPEDLAGVSEEELSGVGILKLLSLDLTTLGPDSREYETIDPYQSIQEAFEQYSRIYEPHTQNPEHSPLIGVFSGKNMIISVQLLRMITFEALRATSTEERMRWAMLMVNVVPVLNTIRLTRFPGAIKFLSEVNYQKNGKVSEILNKNIQAGLGIMEDPQKVLSLEAHHGFISQNAARIVTRVENAIKGGEKDVTLIRPTPQEIPAAGDEQTDQEVREEFLMMIKPPHIADNPEILTEILKRVYAFGYHPVGMRLVNGEAMPANVIHELYPEHYDFAYLGLRDEDGNVKNLSPHVLQRLREIYAPGKFEGNDLLGPPGWNTDGLQPAVLDPNPLNMIRSFEQIEADHPGLSQRDLLVKLSTYYRFVQQNSGSWDSPLWKENKIEEAPNSKVVHLFRDPEIYGGAPILVPNIYAWDMADSFKDSQNWTLALLLRQDSPDAATFAEMRHYLVGRGIRNDHMLAGTLRGDGSRGQLVGNDASLVTDNQNVVHSSSDPLELLKDTSVLFGFEPGRVGVEKVSRLPYDQLTFGRQLLSAGYSIEEIDRLLQQNTRLRIGSIDSDLGTEIHDKGMPETLARILRYIPPGGNLAALSLSQQKDLRGEYQSGHLTAQVHTDIRPVRFKSAPEGNVVAFVGPSATGKGSIVRRLKGDFETLAQPVKVSNRRMRTEDGETEGNPYYFKTDAEFREMLDRGELIFGWMRGGKGYGTEPGELKQIFDRGKTAIIELQDPEEVRQLRFHYPNAHVVVVLPMDVQSFDPQTRQAWDRELMKRMLAREGDGISRIDLQERLDAAWRSLAELLAIPNIRIIVNHEGGLEAAYAEARNFVSDTVLGPKAELRTDESPVESQGGLISMDMEYGDRPPVHGGIGVEVIGQGRVAAVLMPSSQGLWPIADAGKRGDQLPITDLELKLRQIRMKADENGGHIPVIVPTHPKAPQGTDEDVREVIESVNIPVETFRLGLVPVVVPPEAVLADEYGGRENIPPYIQDHFAALWRLQSEEDPSLTPVMRDSYGTPVTAATGGLGLIKELLQNGKLAEYINKGEHAPGTPSNNVDILYFSHTNDLGGGIDESQLALFENSGFDAMFVVTEADHLYQIREIDGNKLPAPATIVVRHGRPIWSELPAKYRPVIKNGEIKVYRLNQDGTLDQEVTIDNAQWQPEYGAYLVNDVVAGVERPRLVEKIAFPPHYNFSQLGQVMLNTDQLLIRVDTLLRTFGFERREDYLALALPARNGDEGAQKQLSDHINRVWKEKFKPKVLLQQTPVDGKTFPLARFVYPVADLTDLIDNTGYLLVNRENPDNGYHNLGNPRDLHLLSTRQQIDTRLRRLDLADSPMNDLSGPANAVSFSGVESKETIRFNVGPLNGKTYSIENMTTADFHLIVQTMVDLKIKYSRFTSFRGLFLGDVVDEFLGLGLMKDIAPEDIRNRDRRAVLMLRHIQENPTLRRLFLKHLWFDYQNVRLSYQYVSSAIYIALANYLMGRPWYDHQVVNDHPELFENNPTVVHHPVYGNPEITPVAGVDPATLDNELSPSPNKPVVPALPQDLKILFFAEGERAGPNQKLEYFNRIIEAAGIADSHHIDISAADAHYPDVVHQFDEGEYKGPQRVFPFNAEGRHTEPETGRHYRRLDLSDPAQNAAGDDYVVADEDQADIVVASRLAVIYKKEKWEKQNLVRNLLRHVRPGGILLWDTSETDKIVVYQKDQGGHARVIAYIPYEDYHKTESSIRQLVNVFDMDAVSRRMNVQKSSLPADKRHYFDSGENVERVLRTAYMLANRYTSEGHDVFTKRAVARFIGEATQDVIGTASIFIQHLDDQVIQQAFDQAGVPAEITSVILAEKGHPGESRAFSPDWVDDIYYPWLEDLYRTPKLSVADQSQAFLADAKLVFFNQRFTIEHGILLEDGIVHQALRITDTKSQTGPVVFYGAQADLSTGPRRSELRIASSDAVPLSRQWIVSNGQIQDDSSVARTLTDRVAELPVRRLERFGLEPFSAAEALKSRSVYLERESETARVEGIENLKTGKPVLEIGRTVEVDSEGVVAIEQTLATDMIEAGFESDLAKVAEKALLTDHLKKQGVENPAQAASEILLEDQGTAEVIPERAASAVEERLYYFLARRYDIETTDADAQAVAQAQARHEYQNHFESVASDFTSLNAEGAQVIVNASAQGAVIFTEEAIRRGTVTVPELVERIENDLHGKISVHFIAGEGRDSQAAETYLRAFLGKEADRLLYHAARNPRGIHIHTSDLQRGRSTQAVINRVVTGLKQSLPVLPGQSEIQSFQIVVMGAEPLVKSVRSDVSKFVDQGNNIGLLTAAYLFIPYRGRIPDSVFQSGFRQGALPNSFYLTPIEKLGFFLYEQAKVKTMLAYQA